MPALNPVEATQTAPTLYREGSAEMPTILTIDDDQVDRMSIQRMLKKSGYNVILASTAAEGIELFSENDIDCVLLDYFMPGTHGIAVLTAIRKINELTPIIMITGQGDEMIAVDAMKHGAVDYLPKDELTSDMLKAIIDRSLEHSTLMKQVSSQKFQLENYAHVLAHEIKEPLRTIRAHLRVVLSQASRDMGDVAKDHLRQISDLLTNLDNLVDAAVSGVDSSESEKDTQPAKLIFIIRRAIDSLEKSLTERKLDVNCNNVPNITLPLNFSQLFHSLCKLYVDFSDVSHIQINAQESGDGWFFSVGNNVAADGAIPKNNLAALSETLEELNKQKSLSLQVCKTFIDSKGGKIWCDTTDKLGAIYFRLPKSIIVE